VELTALCRGFIVLIVAMSLAAFILDDPASLIAAGCLIAFIIARGAVFTIAGAQIAGTAAVERTPDQVFSRQGASVRVATVVTMAIRPSIGVIARDLLPPGAILESNQEELQGIFDRSGRCTLHYSMQCRASGELGFRGIQLVLSDPFFSMTLEITRKSCREPTLHIRPRSIFEAQSSGERGEQEMQRYGFVHRSSVRSFREYTDGDDIRSIDWKLSAKYDRLYVRQYADRERLPKMFVFDLPDRERPTDTESFATLREAAGEALAGEIARKKEALLMTVSGPNLIAIEELGRRHTDITGALAQLRPHGRPVHLYRANPGTTLAHGTGMAAWTDGETSFPSRLAGIAAELRKHRTRTQFESQLHRVLRSVGTQELAVFSLADGDCSHLAFIAREAAEAARQVSITVPRRQCTPAVQERLKGLGFRTLRVIG
jgi:uncharacterized protein (DUF58 family)